MGKKGSKTKELQEQLEAALASCATKDDQLTSLQQQLDSAVQQAAALQVDAASSQQLDAATQHLVAMQREAAAQFGDYENRVLILQLQSLVEKYRILDVEALSEQNHELREEVMRLQAENLEMSRLLAESGQRARQDVARIHLALEATAREALATARQRLCAELHAQLDGGLRVLVDEHGELQESMMTLAEQAAELDKQYRSLVTDRRQYKIDAEVEQSMGDMQTRQIVLLKQQLERLGLANQMLQVKCQEQSSRAEAAEGRAGALSHTLARMQAHNQALLRQLPEAGLGLADAGHCDGAEPGSDDASDVTQLGEQLSTVQRQLDKACAARDKWRDKACMYARAASQLQAAVQALQQWGPAGCATPRGHQASHADLKHIWSCEPCMSDQVVQQEQQQHQNQQQRQQQQADGTVCVQAGGAFKTSQGPHFLTPDPSQPSAAAVDPLSSLSAPTIPDSNETTLILAGAGPQANSRGSCAQGKSGDPAAGQQAGAATGMPARGSRPATAHHLHPGSGAGGSHRPRPASAAPAASGVLACAAIPHSLAWTRASRELPPGRRPLSGHAPCRLPAQPASAMQQLHGQHGQGLSPRSSISCLTSGGSAAADCKLACQAPSSSTPLDPSVQNVGHNRPHNTSHLQVSRLHSAGPGRSMQPFCPTSPRSAAAGYLTAQRPSSASPAGAAASAAHNLVGLQAARHAVRDNADEVLQPTTQAAAVFARSLSGGLGASSVPGSSGFRPCTALQPRALRPGAVRYFGATKHDPFLAMEAHLIDPVAGGLHEGTQ